MDGRLGNPVHGSPSGEFDRHDDQNHGFRLLKSNASTAEKLPAATPSLRFLISYFFPRELIAGKRGWSLVQHRYSLAVVTTDGNAAGVRLMLK